MLDCVGPGCAEEDDDSAELVLELSELELELSEELELDELLDEEEDEEEEELSLDSSRSLSAIIPIAHLESLMTSSRWPW